MTPHSKEEMEKDFMVYFSIPLSVIPRKEREWIAQWWLAKLDSEISLAVTEALKEVKGENLRLRSAISACMGKSAELDKVLLEIINQGKI